MTFPVTNERELARRSYTWAYSTGSQETPTGIAEDEYDEPVAWHTQDHSSFHSVRTMAGYLGCAYVMYVRLLLLTGDYMLSYSRVILVIRRRQGKMEN
jgi:hypothetical protein